MARSILLIGGHGIKVDLVEERKHKPNSDHVSQHSRPRFENLRIDSVLISLEYQRILEFLLCQNGGPFPKLRASVVGAVGKISAFRSQGPQFNPQLCRD